MLHFEDEAAGLELNQKMERLKQKREQEKLATSRDDGDDDEGGDDRKRPAEPDGEQSDPNKRLRIDRAPDVIGSTSVALLPPPPPRLGLAQPVQKFRYVDAVQSSNGKKSSPGYRILLATYADVSAAAEDDPEKAKLIQSACQAGGDYVGCYFYQYEVRYSWNGPGRIPDCQCFPSTAAARISYTLLHS